MQMMQNFTVTIRNHFNRYFFMIKKTCCFEIIKYFLGFKTIQNVIIC